MTHVPWLSVLCHNPQNQPPTTLQPQPKVAFALGSCHTLGDSRGAATCGHRNYSGASALSCLQCSYKQCSPGGACQVQEAAKQTSPTVVHEAATTATRHGDATLRQFGMLPHTHMSRAVRHESAQLQVQSTMARKSTPQPQMLPLPQCESLPYA